MRGAVDGDLRRMGDRCPGGGINARHSWGSGCARRHCCRPVGELTLTSHETVDCVAAARTVQVTHRLSHQILTLPPPPASAAAAAAAAAIKVSNAGSFLCVPGRYAYLVRTGKPVGVAEYYTNSPKTGCNIKTRQRKHEYKRSENNDQNHHSS